MAIRLTKTSKIIIAISIVVLSIALGFLIWRVNQPDTTAPTDSEAGGGAGACCYPLVGCVAGWKCVVAEKGCTDCEPPYATAPGVACGTGKCRTDFKCENGQCCPPESLKLGRCVKETDEEGPSEGECKDTHCEWPKVTMSGRPDASVPVCRCEECSGKVSGQPWTCKGKPPTCTPKNTCPSGQVSCGTSDSYESDNPECRRQGKVYCTVYHPDCNNPSRIHRYCKPTVVNTCDGGSWVNKPTGNIEYEKDISFTAKAKDKMV
jgi:hypothetical protein